MEAQAKRSIIVGAKPAIGNPETEQAEEAAVRMNEANHACRYVRLLADPITPSIEGAELRCNIIFHQHYGSIVLGIAFDGCAVLRNEVEAVSTHAGASVNVTYRIRKGPVDRSCLFDAGILHLHPGRIRRCGEVDGCERG